MARILQQGLQHATGSEMGVDPSFQDPLKIPAHSRQCGRNNGIRRAGRACKQRSLEVMFLCSGRQYTIGRGAT